MFMYMDYSRNFDFDLYSESILHINTHTPVRFPGLVVLHDFSAFSSFSIRSSRGSTVEEQPEVKMIAQTAMEKRHSYDILQSVSSNNNCSLYHCARFRHLQALYYR